MSDSMNYFTLLQEQAERYADKTFMVFDDVAYSYRSIYEQVQNFATHEWRFHNVGGGHKVLVITADAKRQVVAFLGLMATGNIPILGHYDLPQAAVQQLVRANKLDYVLLDDKLIPTGFAVEPVTGVCMGVLSSGSTDVPKVMYRTYASWADFFAEQNRIFATRSTSVVFVEGSFSFTGNLSVWAGAFYAGATIVVAESLQCRQWLRLINKYQVTVIYLVPVKLRLLTKFLRQATYPSVKMILAGSQLLEAATANKLKAAFPQSEIMLYYGASELNYITYLNYEELLRFPMSVGRPCRGVKVTVRDGLIYVDTPYGVEGVHCPYTLDDMGYFNAEGYLIFLGRKTQVINRGGFKVSCAKIENIATRLPYVQEIVVLPYQDQDRGQEIAAFIVAGEEFNLSNFKTQLKKELMTAELPKRFIVLPALPLNASGKPDVRKLRALLK